MGIDQDSFDSVVMSSSFTSCEVLGSRNGNITEEPALSYADRQKLDTRRMIDTQVGGVAVKWSSLSYEKVNDIINKDGACQGASIDTFYPESYQSVLDKSKIAAARLVCDSCDLQPDCLEYALDTKQKNGIWGGATEKERRRMIKSPQRAEQRAKKRAAA